jgi:hypothetical protein
MTRSPAQGMESFVQLFQRTPVAEMNQQAGAAWSDPAGMLGRIDESVKQVQLAGTTNAVQELRFRKRVFMDAIEELSGAWINGYILARAVFGTVLIDLHFSKREPDVQRNGQQLIDFAETIGVVSIFANLPDAAAEVRSGISTGAENDVLVRNLGAREAEGAYLTSWAMGVATGIAEHELFGAELDGRTPG